MNNSTIKETMQGNDPRGSILQKIRDVQKWSQGNKFCTSDSKFQIEIIKKQVNVKALSKRH